MGWLADTSYDEPFILFHVPQKMHSFSLVSVIVDGWAGGWVLKKVKKKLLVLGSEPLAVPDYYARFNLLRWTFFDCCGAYEHWGIPVLLCREMLAAH
jgi:hypothetical protein